MDGWLFFFLSYTFSLRCFRHGDVLAAWDLQTSDSTLWDLRVCGSSSSRGNSQYNILDWKLFHLALWKYYFIPFQASITAVENLEAINHICSFVRYMSFPFGYFWIFPLSFGVLQFYFHVSRISFSWSCLKLWDSLSSWGCVSYQL